MPTIETNSVEIYYQESGGGPPIVLIKGAMSDRQLGAPVVDRLVEEFRCIRYEIREHGRTESSDRGGQPFELYENSSIAIYLSPLNVSYRSYIYQSR